VPLDGGSLEVDVFRSPLLPLLLAICVSLVPACTGGCWLTSGEVITEPKTDCLTLYTGDSSIDHVVCAVPHLAGVNNCTEILTLPKVSLGDNAVVPGGNISWWPPTKSVPPMIMVNQTGSSTTEYVISATLGAQNVTITIPVHD
jgi:hypothetical protein